LLGQAVEYLLGDGSEDARIAFESQLESDQAAREALADAVSIVAALRSRAGATKYSSSVPARKVAAVRLWIGLAVAVSMMLALGWWYAAMQRLSSFQREEPRAELAIRWSELRSGDADAEIEETDAGDSGDVDEETPSWIVAGLIGLREGMSDSVPPRPEEF
jgi:ferric-dicitrate binding protein FerR (iron transport regulator)